MSIDRCNEVRKIIESQFARANERVTGDESGPDGVYIVWAQAPNYERARSLVDVVTVLLANQGIDYARKPEIEVHGITHVTLTFAVDVAGIRGGL